MQHIFLSHDVDWRKQGASIEHILARKDRFDDDILRKLDTKNPYYNLPEYMEIEERFSVRSTFFFRTIYENGDFHDYEDDIKNLIDGGWEIGLHTDPESVYSFEKIENEKKNLEKLTKKKILGNRVHYLGFDEDFPAKLQKLEFVYDSSIRNSKDLINSKEMGFFHFDKIIEFPITLMDAYMFTYMKINEEQIIPTFKKTLDIGREVNSDFNVISVIWHDNVLKMKGGRMYEKILEFLSSEEDVEIHRGIDIAGLIDRNVS